MLVAMGISLTAQAASKTDTLRVLAIGNSFSEDAVEQNLSEIARENLKCAIIGNMYIGGCSLERHCNNIEQDAPAYRYRKIDADGKMVTIPNTRLSYALLDEKWDVITLQQQSSRAGKFETFEPYMAQMLEYVRKFAPKKVKIMFHQTWAYTAGSTNPGFELFGCNQKTMYDSLMVVSKKVCDKYGLGVIPVGTAVQNVRNTNIRDNVTRDGHHLNHAFGRYTAACTWYEALFGVPVTGTRYRTSHMTAEQATICQLAAYHAVRNPYSLTDFGFHTPKGQIIESRVPKYTLPDALTMNDGTPVTSKEQWEKQRRPELLEMFTREMYGRAPEKVKYQEFKILEVKPNALNGLATRKRVAIYLNEKHSVWIDLMVYTPNKRKRTGAPMFLGINFWGNQAITDETDVTAPTVDEMKRYGAAELKETGFNARRWPLETILNAGYGVATFYRGDVEPDFDDTNNLCAQKLYPKTDGKVCGPDQWGSIAVWAWGLSRALDYLECDSDVNASKVAVIGHSRLGKASLWAGAVDPRFAMVIANGSGCGGAAISRRAFGETVGIINRSFPHWFCDNFKKYGENEEALPFDQHELIALIAPRPICVGSGDQDYWADPEGERLGLEAAKPVYELYGKDATRKLQYHVRPGKHDILEYDWNYYLKHADKYLK